MAHDLTSFFLLITMTEEEKTFCATSFLGIFRPPTTILRLSFSTHHAKFIWPTFSLSNSDRKKKNWRRKSSNRVAKKIGENELLFSISILTVYMDNQLPLRDGNKKPLRSQEIQKFQKPQILEKILGKPWKWQ